MWSRRRGHEGVLPWLWLRALLSAIACGPTAAVATSHVPLSRRFRAPAAVVPAQSPHRSDYEASLAPSGMPAQQSLTVPTLALAEHDHGAEGAARGASEFGEYEAFLAWLLPQFPVLGADPLTAVLHQQVPLGISQAQGGLWLEFGVFSGQSINLMASHTVGSVHGFDSFQGLPEDWHIGSVPGAAANSRTLPKGYFDLHGGLPPVRPNVVLHKGWFHETLPLFVAQLPPLGAPGSVVSLLHVDCDLYSSTAYVLDMLAPRIVPGTVIVFDELVNFPEYRNHELKALYEFVLRHNKKFIPVGCMCAIDPQGVALEGDGSCLAAAIRIVA